MWQRHNAQLANFDVSSLRVLVWLGLAFELPAQSQTRIHGVIASEIEPTEDWDMKARLVKFGEIEVEGERYTHDVVIDGGKVRKRKKGPSKRFREKFGHTPLSVEEKIPWGGKRLIVGTGAHAALPIMDEVIAEAKRRGVEIIAASTSEVCQLLEDVKKGQVYAILHCTC
jgi:hypothetical protein